MRLSNCLLPSALLLCAALAHAQPAPPVPYEAQYEVWRNGKAIGSSTTTLTRDGDTWHYRSETVGERGMARLVGLKITQSLDFRWHEGRPQPIRSRYDQEATLGSRQVNVDYDPQAGSYLLVDRKGEHRHPMVEDTVDRYGSGVAVTARLADGDRAFTLKVAHADGVRDWRFQVSGEEAVETPSGTISALKVERIRDDDDRQTTSWHDPARDFVMVRLLQVEDGDTLESRLRSYTPR